MLSRRVNMGGTGHAKMVMDVNISIVYHQDIFCKEMQARSNYKWKKLIFKKKSMNKETN